MLTRWRCPPDSSCGYREAKSAGRPTRSSSSATRCRRPRRPSASRCTSSGSATVAPMRDAGVQRGERILQHQADPAAQRFLVASAYPEHVGAVQRRRSGVRPDQPGQRGRHGRLARPGFTDQRQCGSPADPNERSLTACRWSAGGVVTSKRTSSPSTRNSTGASSGGGGGPSPSISGRAASSRRVYVVLRAVEDVEDRCLFHGLAFGSTVTSSATSTDHPQVVADPHHRGAEVALQIAYQVDDLSLRGHVQRRSWVRRRSAVRGRMPARSRSSPAGADRPTAGADNWQPGLRVGQADRFEQLQRPRPRLAPGRSPMCLKRFGDLALQGQQRVERRPRVLKHEPDPAAVNAAQRTGRRADQLRRRYASAAKHTRSR